ncbi:MAG: hypothetical protein FVQ80_12825 [Planctomycetes bacterium]|nr:hypothetical protein [Planctomycetota bacterium]
MEIDKTINKWFQETADEINANHKPDKPKYDLAANTLPLAHNYCNAVFILLDNDKKLPAMALLRILGELVFRLIWCLYKDNPQKESVDVRIQRWLKESYHQREKHLRKLHLAFPDQKDIKKELEYVKNEKEKIPYEFPGGNKGKKGNFYESLEELPPGYKDQLYLLLYSKHNIAIHIDMLVLSKLISQKENVRQFSGDFDDVDTGELKMRCMDCAFHIISYIRIVYDLNYEKVKAEYLEVKKKN